MGAHEQAAPRRVPEMVHVEKDQAVLLDAGDGVQLHLERYASGAVELRNLVTGGIIRTWSPKEANG